MTARRWLVLVCLLFTARAQAQVQTGSITGIVSDTSGAVLPGVVVTITGDRLIEGAQTYTTDATGAYRFDRLPPGDYHVKFELQGFKTVEQADVRINAAFVATINAKLEVGSLEETITVTGRVAGGRRPLQRAADDHEPGDSRRRADRARPVVAGQADSRRPGRHLRRRRHPVGAAEQPVGARLEHQRRQLQHRRRDRELAGRRRRRDDDVLRPGHVRRGQLHDLGDPGRSAGRRRVHQHGDQGRRQPVAGQRPLLVRQRRPAVRELGRHAGRQSRTSSATRPRRPTTSTCRAAARSSRTGSGSTAPIASGWSTSWSTPGTPTARRRSTTTT